MRLVLVALVLCVACAAPPGGDRSASHVTPSEAGRATAARSGPGGDPECPRALALEPAAIEAELTCLLARYVRIDTTNPPGNEAAAAEFLQGLLAREGIEAELVQAAPGRSNLIARLEGTGNAGALMLMHHMDVVPASAAEWSMPPFAGRVEAGYLWGRGSLDNKGPGVASLMAVLLLRRLGVPLARDLVWLALADEESGGAHGSRWLTEHRKDLFQGVEFVLNEGGSVLELEGGGLAYDVEVAQKAPLWLRVTAHGRSGHGGAPRPNSAASVLVRALARVAEHQFPIVVLPEVQTLFAARARAMPEALRSSYQDLRAALGAADFREQFLSDPHRAALVRNTLAITMLGASNKENVVSESASAVLDVRILPGQDAEQVRREITRLLGEPALEVEPILSWQSYASPVDTALFRAIERLAASRAPGAPVTPTVIGGFTDCNAFRAIGITCYGFFPLRLAPDDLSRLHGKDERIRVAALSQAVLDLYALVQSLAPP